MQPFCHHVLPFRLFGVYVKKYHSSEKVSKYSLQKLKYIFNNIRKATPRRNNFERLIFSNKKVIFKAYNDNNLNFYLLTFSISFYEETNLRTDKYRYFQFLLFLTKHNKMPWIWVHLQYNSLSLRQYSSCALCWRQPTLLSYQDGHLYINFQ